MLENHWRIYKMKHVIPLPVRFLMYENLDFFTYPISIITYPLGDIGPRPL